MTATPTLTLTQACELSHIFQIMDLETLELYAENLKHRMTTCAINFIECESFVKRETYNEMKDIYGRVESSLANKKVYVL